MPVSLDHRVCGSKIGKVRGGQVVKVFKSQTEDFMSDPERNREPLDCIEMGMEE